MAVYEHGEYLGTGYDVLVQDTLITKHFEIPIVTVFILTTEMENNYSMGGVFDSYGDDFLDTFNESINGVNSTKPFTIKQSFVKTSNHFMPKLSGVYVLDILLNFNRLGWFIPLLLGNGGSLGYFLKNRLNLKKTLNSNLKDEV